MQKVTELVLDSGIRVYVTPLSRYQRNALVEASERLYPYPDKAKYEEALSEDIAIPGSVIPAEENDDYKALVREVNRQRSEYVSTAMLNLCLSFPDFKNRQALIEHFAEYLNEQREWLALPEDEWDATLRFGIVRSPSDEAQILSVAKDELPVTEAETTENLRVFRPVLSREKSRIMDYARQHTSGTEGKVPG